MIAPDDETTLDHPRPRRAAVRPTPWRERGSVDPVKVYLRDIGSVPLLSAAREVEICRRIEAAQIALRRALGGVPAAVGVLLAVETPLRRGGLDVQDVLVPPDGREPGEADRATMLRALARVRRLAGGPRRAATAGALAETIGALPLAPALLERMLAAVRGAPARGREARARAEVDARDAEVRRGKRQLMEANLRLVVSVAKRYTASELAFPDLIQEGNVGLMRAVDRFQYRRGFKFSTYATWWIRQAITRAIADQSRTIRMPVHLVESLNRMSREQRELGAALGREPTAEELGRRVGISPAKVRVIQEAARKPLPLELPVGEDAQLGDFLEDRAAVPPDGRLIDEALRHHLERALVGLSPKEREVVRLRFGLDGDPEATLEEVGRRFAVTRERIRQIEVKALRKLRRPLRSRHLRAFLDR